MVRLAAARIGKMKFSNYMVLGDDLVIFSPVVAKSYLKLCDQLGVDVKLEDSIKPKESHSLEIAKRLFRRGVEVSPLPLRLLQKS